MFYSLVLLLNLVDNEFLRFFLFSETTHFAVVRFVVVEQHYNIATENIVAIYNTSVLRSKTANKLSSPCLNAFASDSA